MKAADIPQLIAREINCAPQQVTAVSELLDSGNTVPFIARYRKEATGGLEEEKIRSVEERLTYLRNLLKRQDEILAAIAAQEKLTPELAAAIEQATKLQELEDLYLPFRPKNAPAPRPPANLVWSRWPNASSASKTVRAPTASRSRWRSPATNRRPTRKQP